MPGITPADTTILGFVPEPVILCSKCGKDCTGYFSASYKRVGGENERIPGTEQCVWCDEDEYLESYRIDGVITMKLLMAASMRHQKWADFGEGSRPEQTWLDVKSAADQLKDLVKEFDREVWRPMDEEGLAHVVRTAKTHGMSADTSGWGLGITKFLSLGSAGRALFQIEAVDGHRITLITAEDEKAHRMGIQGITATAKVATGLLTQAIAAGKAGLINLVNDGDVGFG